MTRKSAALMLGLVTAILAGAAPASAQTGLRPYAGASLTTVSVSADHVEGHSAAGGIFAGLALSQYVDVELEVVMPASPFTRTYTGPSETFAPPGASYEERQRLSVITRFDKERDVTASLSAVVVLHPPRGHRVTPGLILGVTNQRARDQTVYTTISIPEGVDPRSPAVAGSTESHSRNIGGPTIGGQLAIALTPRLSVVPDVRYDYGSIGDEINNAVRASVRIKWQF